MAERGAGDLSQVLGTEFHVGQNPLRRMTDTVGFVPYCDRSAPACCTIIAYTSLGDVWVQ